jgi:hypothetical protein
MLHVIIYFLIGSAIALFSGDYSDTTKEDGERIVILTDILVITLWPIFLFLLLRNFLKSGS